MGSTVTKDGVIPELVCQGVFHKDPKLNLSLSWTNSYGKPLASLKIFCKRYFKRHKMLIQIIHIFYYHGRFHVLDVEFEYFQNKATNGSP